VRALTVLGALLALSLLATRCEALRERPDVLLVILDTVRADHLSSYGYARPTTPHLDRLAAEGERYEDAWAQSPWTLPSIATILTGQPPHVHGAGRGPDGVYGLGEGVPTLAQHLSRAGYRTGAIFNVGWCRPEVSSLDRGFEHYDVRGGDSSHRTVRDARETTDAALRWVREQSGGDAPLLLVVHYFDPHLTYDPPSPFDELFEPAGGPRVSAGFGDLPQLFALRSGVLELGPRQRESLVARYDGELRFMDEQIGRLRAGLERLDRWDDALVIVVADHGEEFWDHGGFEHGHSHHREVLHVPLIVRRPGGPVGSVIAGRVRQLDVAPTILEAAGLPIPATLPGKSLGREAALEAIAEGSLWGGDLVSIRSEAGSLIVDRSGTAMRYFAPDDVLERRAVPADDRAGALVRSLETLPAPPRDRPTFVFDEQLLRELRALGYVR
jgi:arylsulfatase A-like enzyme